MSFSDSYQQGFCEKSLTILIVIFLPNSRALFFIESVLTHIPYLFDRYPIALRHFCTHIPYLLVFYFAAGRAC